LVLDAGFLIIATKEARVSCSGRSSDSWIVLPSAFPAPLQSQWFLRFVPSYSGGTVSGLHLATTALASPPTSSWRGSFLFIRQTSGGHLNNIVTAKNRAEFYLSVPVRARTICGA